MARITVEDCLAKVQNRFALAHIASQRSKQLLEGATCAVDNKGNRSIVSALREIAAGKVRWMTEEDLQKEAEELSRKEAISEVVVSPPNSFDGTTNVDTSVALATTATEMEQIISSEIKLNGENGA